MVGDDQGPVIRIGKYPATQERRTLDVAKKFWILALGRLLEASPSWSPGPQRS
jgi:hypothetical protein